MSVLTWSGYTIRILKKIPIFTTNQTIKDNNRYNILIWIYIYSLVYYWCKPTPTPTRTSTYTQLLTDPHYHHPYWLLIHPYTVKLPIPSITYTRGKSERLRVFRAFTRLNIYWCLSEAYKEDTMNTYWQRNKGEGTQKEGLRWERWEGLFHEGPTLYTSGAQLHWRNALAPLGQITSQPHFA